MTRRFLFMGLLVCLVAFGCQASATVLPDESSQAPFIVTTTGTAGLPQAASTVEALSSTAQPLPATQTVIATSTPLLQEFIDPPITLASPTASATFAAYGVTQPIGWSVQGRPLLSYRFGFGSQVLILVGGLHGGYEWNTTLLAYELIDYFIANPEQIPATVSLYIIPSANPDGQYLITGTDGRFTPEDVIADTEPGRFNANEVDLNRNWACGWQTEAFWGSTLVSGGTAPFSEPETAALHTFLLREQPALVIFWHSKADGIFVGGCDEPYQPAKDLANIYGQAVGYQVYDRFTAYPVSGDASDWLVSQNIPSFTVELSTRSRTHFSENLAGVLALLEHYDR